MKYRFSEKFEQQLLRASAGHAPWKAHVEKVYKPVEVKKITQPQIDFLRKGLKYEGELPDTCRAASSLIDSLKRERSKL